MIANALKKILAGVLFIGTSASVLATEPQFFSQWGQDCFVYEHFFKHKRNGIFVEVGAHDGVTFSNTCFFERSMGWNGICVEPIPEVFARLQAHRRCHCVQGCISNRSDSVEFLRVHGPEMLSGIVDCIDSKRYRRIEKEIEQCGGSMEIVAISCFRLDELLLSQGFQHIDFLSLDIGGGELEILRSIDFHQFPIGVICVANNWKDRIQPFLESFGFRRASFKGTHKSCDEIYYNPKFCRCL
jgi:FkbM family methyltransferase